MTYQASLLSGLERAERQIAEAKASRPYRSPPSLGQTRGVQNLSRTRLEALELLILHAEQHHEHPRHRTLGRKRMARLQQAWEGGGEVRNEVAIAIMLPFWAIAFWQGYQINHKRLESLKVEAVQRGFATWVSNENGNTHFEWKEPTP